MGATNAKEEAKQQRQGKRRTTHDEEDSDHECQANANHRIFAEADVLARLLQARTEQCWPRDQRRRITLELSGTFGEELADLRLSAARNDIAVALFDELHTPLQVARSRRSAHRHEGEGERAGAADDE